MKMKIKRMSAREAKQIAAWTYPEPYSLYNMDESETCLKELMNGSYFTVLDGENTLLGYCCFGEPAIVPAGRQFGVYNDDEFTDIGLGMKPGLCGQGLGFDFLANCLAFASKEYKAKRFRLTVAAFNERAIKVYKHMEFRKAGSFIKASEDGDMEFWVMTLEGRQSPQ
jgi:RimJ/RimL family protein N-acetyltransferase